MNIDWTVDVGATTAALFALIIAVEEWLRSRRRATTAELTARLVTSADVANVPRAFIRDYRVYYLVIENIGEGTARGVSVQVDPADGEDPVPAIIDVAEDELPLPVLGPRATYPFLWSPKTFGAGVYRATVTLTWRDPTHGWLRRDRARSTVVPVKAAP